MEQILSNLLVPDNAVIKQATADLKAAMKHEAAIREVRPSQVIHFSWSCA